MDNFTKRRIITQETLSERLRKVREGMGIGLVEAAKITGIRLNYLEALEAGNYSSLPGEIYVKNFLKAYGSLLGLHEAEILSIYEREERIFEHSLMNRSLLGSRDLFGNKVTLKKKLEKSFSFWGNDLSGVALFSFFKRVLAVGLILALFGYLGYEVRGIFIAPELTIFAPVDNLITTEHSIVIVGKTTLGATVMINNQEVPYAPDGSFEEMIELKRGLNEIQISAFKKHSRTKVAYRKIMVKDDGD